MSIAFPFLTRLPCCKAVVSKVRVWFVTDCDPENVIMQRFSEYLLTSWTSRLMWLRVKALLELTPCTVKFSSTAVVVKYTLRLVVTDPL